jgi:hypothetical protein
MVDMVGNDERRTFPRTFLVRRDIMVDDMMTADRESACKMVLRIAEQSI